MSSKAVIAPTIAPPRLIENHLPIHSPAATSFREKRFEAMAVVCFSRFGDSAQRHGGYAGMSLQGIRPNGTIAGLSRCVSTNFC
jgi:hypothetical protein